MPLHSEDKDFIDPSTLPKSFSMKMTGKRRGGMSVLDKDIKAKDFIDNTTGALEWDPHTLPRNFALAMYGKRRSGKSVLLREIVHKLKDRWTDIYGFSSTIDLQPDLFDFIPKSNQIIGFDDSRLQGICDMMRSQKEKIQNNPGMFKKSGCKRVLLIFDDIIADKRCRTNGSFSNLFTLGRHFGDDKLSDFSIIVLSQTIHGSGGLGVTIRGNLDCAIAFRIEADQSRKLYIEQYLSFIDKKQGVEYYSNIIKEPYYACVACHHIGVYTKHQDLVFKYKANLKRKKFMIGRNNKDGIPIQNREVNANRKNGRLTIVNNIPDEKFRRNGEFVLDLGPF